MKLRPYRSPLRAESAERTRSRIVKAAAKMLARTERFSLDVVAKKARVTRLTVYHQFGSRRALLEAVFDDMAARGGLHRIRDVMANPDPDAALQQIVAIFCDFWRGAPAALRRIHAASASDPEFEKSLRARNERRRRLLSVLIGRMVEGKDVPAKVTSDLVDTLFALTSLTLYSELAVRGRAADAVCQLIQALVADVVRRVLSERAAGGSA